MEPIRGGRLVNPPDSVQELWDTAARRRSPADWALQWLWNQPEVSVVLSGMSTMQQVQENVASANVSGPNTLTEEELALVARVRRKYEELCPIPCTQCRYCMPCPNGVNIPRNFGIFNEGRMYNQLEEARQSYARRLPEAQRASACIQCRQCEELCPQGILVSEWMPDVDAVLGEGQAYGACRMLRTD
jgi:predicted aldo/keto reductase-like oxidoreductase